MRCRRTPDISTCRCATTPSITSSTCSRCSRTRRRALRAGQRPHAAQAARAAPRRGARRAGRPSPFPHLQRLGDVALFVAGFLAGSFARRPVDIDYHIATGGRALPARLRRAPYRGPQRVLGGVFAELPRDKFQPLVRCPERDRRGGGAIARLATCCASTSCGTRPGSPRAITGCSAEARHPSRGRRRVRGLSRHGRTGPSKRLEALLTGIYDLDTGCRVEDFLVTDRQALPGECHGLRATSSSS